MSFHRVVVAFDGSHESEAALALGLRLRDPAVGIAFDGSPEAQAALRAGYDIAARCGAAVTLLWALPALGDPLGREARLHADEALDAAADAAPAAVNPRTLLLHGEPGDVIRSASDGIVDLLVTGSRGYGPMHRALLGSVSESLAEGSPHPVLVLPRRPAPAAGAPAPTLEATEAR